MKFLTTVLLLLLFSCESQKNVSEMSEQELVEYAKGIHERVITLDTHDDINTANFTMEKNYTTDLGNQVNLPKMEEGGLDVAWFIVFTFQGDLNTEGYKKAYENAMDKFNAIHRLTKKIAPDKIELALTSDDVRRIWKSGKKVAMIGVENGYPVGTDISNVKKFYDLGARYMSLSHTGNNQLSDAHNEEDDGKRAYNGGLSDLGKQVIAEMNKWGMMVDLSHPSIKANREMLKISKAPVIASHSSASALSPDVTRNMRDEELVLLKENGGVIQTTAFKSYLKSEKFRANRDAKQQVIDEAAKKANFKLLSRGELRKMEQEKRATYYESYNKLIEGVKGQIAAVEKEHPPVDVKDFIDHIDYLVKKIGIDHVGISSDFDGGGGVKGWNDASETLNVTLELVRRGYTEEQISKMWSGNLLRVLDEVQKIAKEIQASGN